MDTIFSPADFNARIELSRPFPRPLTTISTFSIPYSNALPAAFFAAVCAAKGVFLREPLKPDVPADAQQTVFPKISEIVIIVLLKVVLILAIPTLTTFFLFFSCFYFCHKY
jgi:hypothetical protein